MHDIKINGAKNKFFDTKRVSQKLIDFATEEGFKVDRLEYNFVDSEKMYSLNKDFLNHDTNTDVAVTRGTKPITNVFWSCITF